MELNELLQQGRLLEQAGRLHEAEARYRQAFQLAPEHPQVLESLGGLAYQAGQFDWSVKLLERAALTGPPDPTLELKLGLALLGAGRVAESSDRFRRALALDESAPEAHYFLGNSLLEKKRFSEAERHFRHALALRPAYAAARGHLGQALRAQGRLEEAEVEYRIALAQLPDSAEVRRALADLLREQGALEEATEHWRLLVGAKPGDAELLAEFGRLLRDQGRYEEALAAFQTALESDPRNAATYNDLGVTLHRMDQPSRALVCFEAAIRLDPALAVAYHNRGIALDILGDPEAEASFRKALELEPGYVAAHSSLLMSLNYKEKVTPSRVYEEHVEWGRRFAPVWKGDVGLHANDQVADRRLRIGYVSEDFRAHSVAFFLEPILARHDKSTFHVTCYSDVHREDATTHRLTALADVWRPIVGLSDDEVADLVRRDRIDILVDLGGHTGAVKRLGVFARKMAPVQVSYLGYPNTTGLAAMDYRLTDAHADPPGASDRLHTETLIRLPEGFLCYRAPNEAPAVTEAPCLIAGAVTFGCFNNVKKIGSAVAAAWAQILRVVPDSRLLLKSKYFADEGCRERTLARLSEAGVDVGRVTLLDWEASLDSHLGLYSRVDIALDTFPYNGTTTTCEALWMGVPVVTLRGDRHASRVGASILTQVGLPDLIAGTEEDYVETTVRLAGERDRASQLRLTMRERTAESPLMAEAAFTAGLEEAYREMWARWCSGAGHA